jgi:hypothetical protein
MPVRRGEFFAGAPARENLRHCFFQVRPNDELIHQAPPDRFQHDLLMVGAKGKQRYAGPRFALFGKCARRARFQVLNLEAGPSRLPECFWRTAPASTSTAGFTRK